MLLGIDFGGVLMEIGFGRELYVRSYSTARMETASTFPPKLAAVPECSN